MKPQDIAEIAVFAAVVIGAAPFLGAYMARVYSGERHPLSFLEPFEKLFYKVTGIDSGQEMGWKKYALALLAFSLASVVLLFLILVGQGFLPLNPQKFQGMRWDLALNTTISFVTNTNWQAYSGEASLTTSRRRSAWPCRTSSRPRRGWPSRSPWSAASHTAPA